MPSWIQYHILNELTCYATRRYSQLRPRDVEGNLFMYHLKGLMRDGLVMKNDRDYTLSPAGLEFAGTLSLATGKTRKQPKVLTAVVYQNAAGEYLWSRWHRQPNIGLVSFPHGMVHYGETLQAMAALELAEKGGLTADLTNMGTVEVRGHRDDTLDRHMLVHLFRASNVQPHLQEQLRPEVSEPFWARFETLGPDQFVPGFYEIAQLVQQSEDRIFAELDVRV
jgi:ADP-ribose pyrophosphatase YjhB (NUDIX family)